MSLVTWVYVPFLLLFHWDTANLTYKGVLGSVYFNKIEKLLLKVL